VIPNQKILSHVQKIGVLNRKSLFLFLFLSLTITQVAKSQNGEFVVGAAVGIYGIHIVGDIDKMYSQTGGEMSGTGGYSIGFNVKRYFSKNTYGAFELRYIRKGSIYEFITSVGTVANQEKSFCLKLLSFSETSHSFNSLTNISEPIILA